MRVLYGVLAVALLSACAHLHILITSREALHVQGEQEYLVPPLTVPHSGSPSTETSALQYEAVQLFVQRVQAVQPTLPDRPCAQIRSL